MELHAGLWQKQTLKLAMTQELKQAIKVLEYTADELAAFLEAEATENPFIQLEPSDLKQAEYRSRHKENSSKNYKGFESKRWFEQIPQQEGTLYDNLFFQLSMKALPKYKNAIMKEFIYNIDLNGYFSADIAEIAMRTSISAAKADKYLKMLQSFEPAGVGARNLQECLLLQVRRLNDKMPLSERILSDHFLDFAEKRWKKLSKALKVSILEIQEAADFIQTLNPRPGARFHKGENQFIIPDLVVTIHQNRAELHLFEKHLPKISFQKDYYKNLSSYKDQQVQQFLKDKTKGYRSIAKAVSQRKKTLLEVGNAILEKQLYFFLKGPSHLKPMTLKEIAEDIGVHESTVSRAVRGKFIQTPMGTYELKKFFTAAIPSYSEDGLTLASAGQIKKRLQEMILEEHKTRPLSDQSIADIFNSEGIGISRRTIAKYREQLNILPSSKRRRFE